MPADAPIVSWDSLRAPGPVPGVAAATVHGAQLTAARYTLDPGAEVPEHAHDNEEFGQVLEGELVLRTGGTTTVLGPREAFLLPGGVSHGARAGAEGCELLECYAPPRRPLSNPPNGGSA